MGSEIVLVEQPLTAAQSTRLSALIDAEPKVPLAAVVSDRFLAPSGRCVVMARPLSEGRVGAGRPLIVPTVVGASRVDRSG